MRHFLIVAAVLLAAFVAGYLLVIKRDPHTPQRVAAPGTAYQSRDERDEAPEVVGRASSSDPMERPTRERSPLPQAGEGPSDDTIVSRKPGSHRYDPVVLVRIGEGFPLDLAAKESRREPFASEREETLTPVVRQRLSRVLPDGRLDRLECFTSSCVVDILVDDEEELIDAAVLSLQSPGRYADMVQPHVAEAAEGGLRRVRFGLAFSRENRGAEQYRHWLEERRREEREGEHARRGQP
jgi:hypothetical protein